MWRKLRVRLLVLASMLVGLDQVVQHLVIREGSLRGTRIAPYDPPLFTQDQRDWTRRTRERLRTGEVVHGAFPFDAELGWCPRRDSGHPVKRWDWSGSRIGFDELPREKTPGITRVCAVGCSFTFGDEVENEETWGALLDRDLDDLEVANLGVGAFGIDQALLRLRRDGLALEPDEVWLGILPCALPRALTVYRPALRPWTSAPMFKPRYVLDEAGRLELLPNPARSLADVTELVADQARFLDAVLPHDFSVARWPGAYAESGSSLWHHSGLARVGVTLLQRRRPEPDQVLSDARLGLADLARAIGLAAREEAQAHGARFRVLLLPGRWDTEYAATHDEPYWAQLLSSLESAGIETIELTPAILEAGGHANDALWAPDGHYSPAGNRVCADALRAALSP